MRDFLISLKEFAGDNADLFVVEKEQEARDKLTAEHERRAKVGGLLKPSEIEDDELWLPHELRNEFAPRRDADARASKPQLSNDPFDGWDVYGL